MFFRFLATVLLLGSTTLLAQTPSPKAPPTPPVATKPDKAKPDPKKVETPNGPNVVPGLSIPAGFDVQWDEGFISLDATSTGPVDWIVLTSADKIKYRKISDKSIDISVPPVECTITVFCYGVIDGKPTAAARCDINVKGPQGKRPPPNTKPTPNPTPSEDGPFIVTIVEDPTARDPAFTILTKYVDTSNALIQAGHKPFRLSINDPRTKAWLNAAAAKDKKFADALKSTGTPMVVIQDMAGRAVGVIPCPKTKEDLLAILAKEE